MVDPPDLFRRSPVHHAEPSGQNAETLVSRVMAATLGTGSDFLSLIGHRSNTLVMGPRTYHFGDYWRLGLPLSLMVVGIAVPLIAFFWPLG